MSSTLYSLAKRANHLLVVGRKLTYPNVDLSGKVAIVTGGNSGIGYQTAKSLARMGAHTIIACLNMEEAEEAVETIKEELDPRYRRKRKKKVVKKVKDEKQKEEKNIPPPDVSKHDEDEIKVKPKPKKKLTLAELEDMPACCSSMLSTTQGIVGKTIEMAGQVRTTGFCSISCWQTDGDEELEEEYKKKRLESIPEHKEEAQPELIEENEVEKGGEGSNTTPNEEEVKSKTEGPSSLEGTSNDISKEKVKIESLPLDLSSFKSTKEFVRLFKEKNIPLDYLINNAAIFSVPYRRTGDGFESQLQINHLGPMLLTLELLPILIETAASSEDGRIVFVSSILNGRARSFNPNTLNSTVADYDRLDEYSNSKLYNIMTAIALQRRLKNTFITVSSLHPGFVQTASSQGIGDLKKTKALHDAVFDFIGLSPEEGAATSLNCAINPDLKTQKHFYYDCCHKRRPNSEALNEKFQEQLWAKSFEFMNDHISPEIIEEFGPLTEEEIAKMKKK